MRPFAPGQPKEIFGDNVTMEVQRAWEHPSGVILHAKYDGDFDKTNLPVPLILTNYFVLKEGKIAQLITLLNKTIWEPGAGLTADIQKEGSHHE